MKEKHHVTQSSASLVEQPFTLDCPHCKAHLLEVGKDYFKFLDEQVFIRGESFGVADPCPSIKRKTQSSFYEVGQCYKCNNAYVSLRFRAMQAKLDETISYFTVRQRYWAFTNYIVISDQQKWVISRAQTEKGILLDNMLGPLPMPNSFLNYQSCQNESSPDCSLALCKHIDLLISTGQDLFIDPAARGGQK